MVSTTNLFESFSSGRSSSLQLLRESEKKAFWISIVINSFFNELRINSQKSSGLINSNNTRKKFLKLKQGVSTHNDISTENADIEEKAEKLMFTFHC